MDILRINWLSQKAYKAESRDGDVKIDFTFYDDEFEGTSAKVGTQWNQKSQI